MNENMRFVRPFSRPLCPLPENPVAGYRFRHEMCGAEFEAIGLEDGRVLWYCTYNGRQGCLHPWELCEPVPDGETVAVSIHHVIGAYECHGCGEWVVPFGEPVITI